ncbi:glycosyl transferase [Rhodococcoides trifolii]|uniref:Glycosyl transferase n=1 Tax=Rhodococcoides trifolii TaxID=908250 RepID=A0A917G595_9NOCA|nr:glycosyltransferase [Rhodococcus trifolii]GGG23259.1 glycosyl transferase [Rhodococcus trifolii]
MTEVSVVIAAYRAADVIDVQLEALAEQDYSGSWEVIVSDNEGSDALRRYLAAHPLRDSLSLRVVDSSDVPGTSHARNVGTRASSSTFVAYCDQDDAVHPGWLAALVAASAAADLVGGPLERDTLNDPVVASWRALPDPTEPVVLGRYLPMTFGCNLGISRAVFDAVGGWNEDYPTAGGDVEFCWRVQKLGYTFAFAPDAMVAYRYRTELVPTFEQAAQYGCAEARVAAHFRAPGRQWWWFPAHAAVVVALAPVWPWAWSRRRRGEWMWVSGNLFGRIQGSLRYRYRYL